MHPRWRLSHARGFLLLDMPQAAAEELALLPEPEASHTDVLILRTAIFHQQADWLMLMPIARELVARKPEDPSFWISWAYATRRALSLQEADAILREAELRHPNEALIQFNLGCYACQLGCLEDSLQRIRRALALDATMKDSAASDPDLAPLREQGLL